MESCRGGSWVGWRGKPRSARTLIVLGRAALLTAAVGCFATSATAQPLHMFIGRAFAQPPSTAGCELLSGVRCYRPSQLRQAYDMSPLYEAGFSGSGRTIVIVDAFGSPTIHRDLRHFDKVFRLPDPPSLQIIQPSGRVPRSSPNRHDRVGWAEETSLDVEYAHAMAPGANILLVETPVDETEGPAGFPQIVRAENFVIDHDLGDVISQSFGATEQTFRSPGSLRALRGAVTNAAARKVTVVAASGDQGASGLRTDLSSYDHRVTSWPASDPLVTAVGGTHLHLNAHGLRTAPDSVWNQTSPFGVEGSSGGGRSAVFSRPSYEASVASVVGDHRGMPDLSMSADPVLVYTSFKGDFPGFQPIGGTSLAAPLFAGIVAIADQAAGHRLGLLNPALYALGFDNSGIVDVTHGNNTFRFQRNGRDVVVRGFRATAGYDLSTGLGTVDGARLVTALARSG